MYLFDQLAEQYPGTHSFHFIMGSDLIKSLHWWDEGERIINEMKCVIFRRKGYNNDELFSHPNFPKNNPIEVDEENSLIGVISATEIFKTDITKINEDFSGDEETCFPEALP